MPEHTYILGKSRSSEDSQEGGVGVHERGKDTGKSGARQLSFIAQDGSTVDDRSVRFKCDGHRTLSLPEIQKQYDLRINMHAMNPATFSPAH